MKKGTFNPSMALIISFRQRKKSHHHVERRRLSLAHLLLCENDSPQQLIFQALRGDSKIDHGGPSADLGRVGRVGQLGGDVQSEAAHHIYFPVTHFHLFFFLIKRKLKVIKQSFIPLCLFCTGPSIALNHYTPEDNSY